MATSENYDKGPRETHPRPQRGSSSVFYNPNLWLLKHGVLPRQSRSPPGETRSNLPWMFLFSSFTSATLRGPILISFPPVKMQGKRGRVRDRQAWHAPGISVFGGSQCEAILVYKTSSRPACLVMRLCFKQIHTQRSRWLEKYAVYSFHPNDRQL